MIFVVFRKPNEKSGLYEDCEVVERLQDQQQTIQDLRGLVEYQVSIQTSLVREIECLKVQGILCPITMIIL